MTLARIAAVLLIGLGAAGLFYKEFSYTKETHEAQLGGMEFSLKEQKTLQIPVWASGGVLALGVALLLLGGRKSS